VNKNILKTFWYWLEERQNIYLKKEAGDPKPWTQDPILQEYKFTNVFRQQDRVTVELNKRYKKRDSHATLFWKIILFRMFNLPETYDELFEVGMVNQWNERKAKRVLHKRKELGHKIFTGAYIISNAGNTRPKIDLVCEALTNIWKHRESILAAIKIERSIEATTNILSQYPMIGKFIGYEIATDLRWTPILNQAKDIYTWANPGPGARRGCNRIWRSAYNDKAATIEQYMDEMRWLLAEAPRVDGKKLEMRDIEHSLCEFDKYMRVYNGECRPRSKYDGEA